MKGEEIYIDGDFEVDIFEGFENQIDESAVKKIKNKLVNGLSKLSNDEYLVLSLYYEEDMINMKEIGEIMELDESEANLIRSKAMLKLKTQFTPASLKL